MDLKNPEQDFNAGKDINGDRLPGERSYLENNTGSQDDKVGNEDKASTQVVLKRQHMQKTLTCNAVQAAQGEGENAVSADKNWSKKGKHQVTAKNNFVGAGEVKDWADKLTSSKSLHMLLSQQSLSTISHHPRSTSSTSTGSALKFPLVLPMSPMSPMPPLSPVPPLQMIFLPGLNLVISTLMVFILMAVMGLNMTLYSNPPSSISNGQKLW
ncbi:hypothetical protein BKA83DRAFT_4481287 [Pisolithus microcarpus]|nr:hypothetical protein BKA83DRAFT_4481287 [Pisolithus microcarpus]